MRQIGYFLLFTALVFVDRLTKYWVEAYNIAYDNGSFFSIHLSYNRGVSWGMFHSENSLYFTLLSCVIFLTLSYFCWYSYQVYKTGGGVVPYIFVCAGAVSNFIDRLLYGQVIDFILFYWQDLNFPIFNIADTWIFLGVVYILCFQYQDSYKVFVKE